MSSPDVDTDRLVALASELVMRVLEVDPERNRTWLLALTDDERWGLLFTLAAMVDPNVPLPVALGWTFPLAREVTAERFGPAPQRGQRKAA